MIENGLTPEKISQIAAQKGDVLPGADAGVGGIAGLGIGAAKGGARIARGTAQALQGVGQRALSAISGEPLEKIQRTTGFQSLDPTTPRGASVSESLTPRGTAEQIGSVGADVASFFLPVGGVVGAGGRAAQAVGRKAVQAGVGVSAKEAPLLQNYFARNPLPQRIAAAITGKTLAGKPVTNADTIIRQNLFGTKSNIGVQAKRASSNLWKGVVQPALKQSKERVSFPQFIDEIAEQINKVPDLSRRRQLETALKAFREDFGKVGEISLEELQRFKEGWTKFLPDKAFKGQPIAASFREVQNMASQLARNKINTTLGPEVKAAYLDYSNLKNLEKMGVSALAGGGLKGGTGTLISEIASRALIPITTVGGLTLYKVGKGLEFVGRPGLKFLGEIFGAGGKSVPITPKSITPKAIPPKGSGATSPKTVGLENLESEVRKRIALAPDATSYIDDIGKSIVGKRTDMKLAQAPPKGYKRILEKTIEEYDGDINKVTDIARNTVVVYNKKAGDDAIRALSKRSDLAREPKIQTPDKFMGYEGAIINIKTPNGLVSEVQVVSPKMIYGKSTPEFSRSVLGEKLFQQIAKETGLEPGLGHKIYERVRSLEKTDPDYLKKFRQLEKESIDYYGKLR